MLRRAATAVRTEPMKRPPKTPPRRRRSRILRWSVEIVLLLAVYLGVHAWLSRDLALGPAPPLAGPLLDGGPPAPLVGDTPVLVHFWATWCPVCRLEQESIDSIAGDHPVITVALQSGNAGAVAAHLHARDLRVPVLNDPDGRIAEAWGVSAVPATFVVRDGVIRYRERGFTTEAGLRLRLWLARVMD